MNETAGLTRHDLLAVADELIATMEIDQDRSVEVKAERVTDQAHAPMVYGLRQHVLRLGAVVVDLYRRDLTLEASALVRQMYECAITAQWAADSREGVPALANETIRQRRALAESMRQSTSRVFREGADEIAHLDDEKFETIAGNQAQSFKARCDALEGGVHAYAIYRALSAYCHASTQLVDEYLIVESETSNPVFRIEPEGFDHDSWLYLAVASMLWATRAFDVLDRDHPHRSYLRGLARKLDTNDVVRLTPRARAAEERAERERRRAKWRRPKSRRRGEGE